MENLLTEEVKPTIFKNEFLDIVNKWMENHSLCFPSERLLEFPE